MEIFLDGQKAPIWFKVLDNSAEGYVGLTTNMNSAEYTEFSITQLDYLGNPVKLGSEWTVPADANWTPSDDAFGSNLTEDEIDGNGTANDGTGNVNTGSEFPVAAAAALLVSTPALAVFYKKRRRKRN